VREREQRCGTCRFCELVEGDEEGDAVCRRHAPSPVYLRMVHQSETSNTGFHAMEVAWPSIEFGSFGKNEDGSDDDNDWSGDWCGEWQPVEPQQTAKDLTETSDLNLAAEWDLSTRFPGSTLDRHARVIAGIRKLIEEGYRTEEDLRRKINARKNSKRWMLVSEIRARLTGEWQPKKSS